MKYGLAIMLSDRTISPAELASSAEARGFESIWLPEHSHIPLSRKSPAPGGGDLPEMYYETLDPFVSLGAAAAVTQTLKLATGVCLVVQRDPIQTAKEVVTLDHVSQGRVIFGVGAGWNAEEMADHGTTDFTRRFKLMRERIEAMKVIWSQSEPEYHGEFVDFDPMISRPLPIQRPHPPIHVGGGFPGAARRAIRYGNGWMPNPTYHRVLEHLPAFRRLAEEGGRDPQELEVSVFGAAPNREAVRAMREAGVSRVIFGLPPAGRDEVLPLVDRYAAIMNEVG